MCGIVGIINKQSKVSSVLLEKMASRLAHRGPDGSGAYCFENIGIAHRRLSFIDLEGGHQPLCNEDERIWITYNGELYNFQELRQELLQFGHEFKTNSDTEVIVHAYEQWGADCVSHFRGMFAFAIVDQIKEEVFVARDHIGIKPIFYSVQDEFTAFASELQAFKEIPNFNFELDLKSLDQFLWLQYIPAPLSVFKSVRKLEPGSYIVFNKKGEIKESKKYWKLKYHIDSKKTEQDWIEEVDKTIRESVKKHLVSEVPFGAFLSGGLDSTLVVDKMQKILDYPVNTFSIGFQEDKYSELSYARTVAEKLSTKHYEEIVKPDALAVLPEIVKHYGEPFGDSSSIPTYYVCQMASKKVSMVLSGDGGDEAFAGYKRHSDFIRYEFDENQSAVKSKIYDGLSKVMPSRFPPKNYLSKWYNYIQYLPKDWRRDLWKSDFQYAVNENSEQFEKLYEESKQYSKINQVQYIDQGTYLPNDILTKVDVASMIHSLEVRTPLVDTEVWNVAAQIPANFNLNNKGGEWSGKLILKKILEKDYSKEFVYRKKMGFSIPMEKWFSSGHSTGDYIRDVLLNDSAFIAKYFNKVSIEKIINSKRYGATWSLLFLEFWLKDFHESA